MARDVNDIVLDGFGSWSDTYGVPTMGFGSAIPSVLPVNPLVLKKYFTTIPPNEYAALEERALFRDEVILLSRRIAANAASLRVFLFVF